jgi:urease accessory protein UreF
LLSGGALLVVLHHAFPITPRRWLERLTSAPAALRYAVVAALFYSAVMLAPEAAPAFIYFQF